MFKLSQNKKLLLELENSGVKIIYPDSVYVEGNLRIGKGTVIYPQVFLTNAEIGENSTIGPVAQIIDSVLGDNCYVGFTSQIKRSKIGNNFKMHHHGYIGDAEIGNNVNISAGAITCNYDGEVKSQTVICDNAFIGCNVNLVAPITIGKGCFIAAGSTLKSGLDTGEGNLIICREREVYIKKSKV
ncbi:MAG: hypothetical protein V1860_00135 [bacterium]